MFADRAKITIRSGKGGDGHVSFRRELYVANGGKFADGQEVQQGLTDSDGVMRQPSEPTREGYTFDGWYWHADYSGYTDEECAKLESFARARGMVITGGSDYHGSRKVYGLGSGTNNLDLDYSIVEELKKRK